MDSGTTAQLPAGRFNNMNGTEMQHCKQQQSDTADDNRTAENHMIKKPLSEPSILSTENDCVEVTQISDLTCPCKNNKGHNNSNSGVGFSNVNAHAMDVGETDSSKMSKLKTKVSGAVPDQGLTNGCCTCDGKDTLTNVDEQGNHIRNVVNHNLPESKTKGTSMPKPLKDLAKSSCNSRINMINEPLLDLTKMVENVCLGSGEASRDLQFSSTMDKLKHADSSKEIVPCNTQAANTNTNSDLLAVAGMDPSFGVIGPAGANLGDADLEELPESLSDFVLGCHENQYAVLPCPPNDSDINTIHIEKEKYPIVLVPYKSEVQMPDIMRLITKDLSEPYSIYTYRYFIHNWPQLCFLVSIYSGCGNNAPLRLLRCQMLHGGLYKNYCYFVCSILVAVIVTLHPPSGLPTVVGWWVTTLATSSIQGY